MYSKLSVPWGLFAVEAKDSDSTVTYSAFWSKVVDTNMIFSYQKRNLGNNCIGIVWENKHRNGECSSVYNITILCLHIFLARGKFVCLNRCRVRLISSAHALGWSNLLGCKVGEWHAQRYLKGGREMELYTTVVIDLVILLPHNSWFL